MLCVKVTKFGRHPSPQPPGDAWVWGKGRKGRTREAYSGYASPVRGRKAPPHVLTCVPSAPKGEGEGASFRAVPAPPRCSASGPAATVELPLAACPVPTGDKYSLGTACPRPVSVVCTQESSPRAPAKQGNTEMRPGGTLGLSPIAPTDTWA